VLLAALFFYAQLTNTSQSRFITALITLVGLILIAYGIYLRESGKGQRAATAKATPVSDTPQPAAAQPDGQATPDA
jgi:hypothetical protein